MATVYTCDICHETIGPTNEPNERVDIGVTNYTTEGGGGMAGSVTRNYHPDCFTSQVEGKLQAAEE